nr:hypothetical protein [Candidatus Sigynarchaeota archaeon]
MERKKAILLVSCFFLSFSIAFPLLQDDRKSKMMFDELNKIEDAAVYTEDFNDGLAQGWNVSDGNWLVLNNRYEISVPQGGGGRTYYQGQQFTNYSFEGKMYLDYGWEVSLLFNIQEIIVGGGKYYQVICAVDGIWMREVAGTNEPVVVHVGSFSTGKWYSFKITTSGTNMSFYLNDTLQFS